ncbi:MAG: hypothetical protein ABIH42_10915, partial [Planctomycetota bacterium]
FISFISLPPPWRVRIIGITKALGLYPRPLPGAGRVELRSLSRPRPRCFFLRNIFQSLFQGRYIKDRISVGILLGFLKSITS